MHRVKRIPICDINQHLTCVLCKGYLIDATAIIECLHSFCKSCLVQYLETNKYCPICEVQVHKTKPLLNIRPDKTLQDIVYKLVPKLFQNEMRRRRDFYESHPETKPSSAEQCGEAAYQHLLPPDETVCITMRYFEATTPPRYLRCQAGVSIGHLQKLIRAKYDLTDNHRIDILYNQDCLNSSLTLMDIAYIYLWKRKGPIELTYRIYEPTSKRLKLEKPEPEPIPISITENSIANNNNNSINNNNWKEVQLRISENGEMSVTGIQDSLPEFVNVNSDKKEIITVVDSKNKLQSGKREVPGLKLINKLPISTPQTVTISSGMATSSTDSIKTTFEGGLFNITKTVDDNLLTFSKPAPFIEEASRCTQSLPIMISTTCISLSSATTNTVYSTINSSKCSVTISDDKCKDKDRNLEAVCQTVNKIPAENAIESVLNTPINNEEVNTKEMSAKVVAEAKEGATKETTVEAGTPKVATIKEATPKVAATKEATPKVATTKEATPKAATTKEATTKEVTNKESNAKDVRKEENKTEEKGSKIAVSEENKSSIISVPSTSTVTMLGTKRKLDIPSLNEPPVKQPKQTILNHALNLHNFPNNPPLKKHSQMNRIIDLSDTLNKNNTQIEVKKIENSLPLPSHIQSHVSLTTNSLMGTTTSTITPSTMTSTKTTTASEPSYSRMSFVNKNIPHSQFIGRPDTPLSLPRPQPPKYQPCYMPKPNYSPIVNVPRVQSTHSSPSTIRPAHTMKSDLRTISSADMKNLMSKNDIDIIPAVSMSQPISINNKLNIKNKPSSPIGYKTLRDPPKSWNSQISKANLSNMSKPVPDLKNADHKNTRPAKFFKMRNNLPRYLGNPASGVKPMYQVHVSPEKAPENPPKSEIKKHSIVKIDPKTLKPISEKAPETTSLSNQSDLKINASSVSIFNPLKLQSSPKNERKSPKSPHSPKLKNPSPPNKREKLNLNFTPSNPFIPNLASPTMSPNQFLYPSGPPGFPSYDPRVMAAYHSLFYSPRLPFPPVTLPGLSLDINQRNSFDMGAPSSPKTASMSSPKTASMSEPHSPQTTLLSHPTSKSSPQPLPSTVPLATKTQATKSTMSSTMSKLPAMKKNAPEKEKSLLNAVEKLTQNRVREIVKNETVNNAHNASDKLNTVLTNKTASGAKTESENTKKDSEVSTSNKGSTLVISTNSTSPIENPPKENLDSSKNSVENCKNVSQAGNKTVSQADSKNISQTDNKIVNQPNSKDVNRPNSKDVSRPDSKGMSQHDGKDIGRPDIKDMSRLDSKDVNRPNSNNVSQPDNKNITQSDSKNLITPNSRNISQPNSKTPTQSEETKTLEASREKKICTDKPEENSRDNKSAKLADKEPETGKDSNNSYKETEKTNKENESNKTASDNNHLKELNCNINSATAKAEKVAEKQCDEKIASTNSSSAVV